MVISYLNEHDDAKVLPCLPALLDSSCRTTQGASCRAAFFLSVVCQLCCALQMQGGLAGMSREVFLTMCMLCLAQCQYMWCRALR